MIEGRTLAALRFGAEAALLRNGPLTSREFENFAAWLADRPEGSFAEWLEDVRLGKAQL